MMKIKTMMHTDTCLTKIAFEICQAEWHLDEIRGQMARLELAGMYPSRPTERWKDDKYLYLYFPNGAPDLKLDAKQRLYIGADPAKIAEARRLVANRRQWEELDRIARHLDRWIRDRQETIQQEAHRSEEWPKAAPMLLGLENAGISGGRLPNHKS